MISLQSSGFLHHVVGLVYSDSSEEQAASIFRAESQFVSAPTQTDLLSPSSESDRPASLKIVYITQSHLTLNHLSDNFALTEHSKCVTLLQNVDIRLLSCF
jgi:hypothetical protein